MRIYYINPFVGLLTGCQQAYICISDVALVDVTRTSDVMLVDVTRTSDVVLVDVARASDMATG